MTTDLGRVRPVGRRRIELVLVLGVAVITALAYTTVSVGATSQNAVASVPARIGPFLAVVVGLSLVVHLTTRRLAPRADPVMVPLVALLNGLGYVMITRLSDRLAGLQATWTLIGVGAFVATLILVPRIEVLARYRYTLVILAIAALLVPLVPGLGFASGGARLWISIGPINLQPGEFAKVALAVFFAAYLAERRHLLTPGDRRLGTRHLPAPADLLPLILAWAASVMIMVVQRDLGSSLLFFTLLVVMLWVATERTSFLVAGLGLFVLGAVAASRVFDHVSDRIAIWLDPWSAYSGKGYQLAQAAFAFAEGGLTGTGLGQGEPQRIPLAENDFIFAAIGEELGLLGASAVLVAYLLLVGAGLRAALRTTRVVDTLLAVGVSTVLAVQTLLIVGGVIRVLPLTGVTLPFVSYGGSSLVANYVVLALLIRISDQASTRVPEGREAEGVPR